MKRVAVFTDFYEADTTYSLNIIIEEQLNMLLDHGYEPIAIAEDIFQPVRVWERVEMRHIPHGVPRGNSLDFYEGWEGSVAKFRAALDTCLDGVEVVISHDLIYQASQIWHNLACRQYAAEHPDVTWLNWVHSATPSPVWTGSDERLAPAQVHMPRSKTVYPNAWSVPRVARNFRCEVDDVAVVPHPTDVCGFLGFQENTKKLVVEKDLLSADAILVYPCRLDRGKQVEYVLRTAAALKRQGRSVRTIILDFHSTGGDKVTYRDWLKGLAIDLGLNEIECTFTSEFTDDWHVRVPREVVRDLMLITNVFVMPSRSETYSLVTQEAALCGAFLVLNHDFPPFRDIFTHQAAFYQFSSNVDALTGQDGATDTQYGDTDAYFHDIALRVGYELDNNPVLAQRTRIRKERNPGFIFKRYIEPLFCFGDG
jgi:glycosyltransferase involved in cell wall biosynthesis